MEGPSYQKNRIVQMMAVQPQWQAVYALGDEDFVKVPLVCWALVEERETGQTEVVGMVAEEGKIELASSDTLLGYDYPGCKVDWAELVQRRKVR